jgi:S1-C subfamily serine protease
MSTKWVIGAALGTAAAAVVMVGTVADLGAAQATPPAAPAETTATASKASSTTKAKAKPSTTAPSTLSVAATKKLALAAAAVISPALVDIRGDSATTAAAGTGIVLTSTGEVLTNYHVINGSTRISAVDVGTGRTYPAVVIGSDPGDDIAVLELVGATGLPVARLGTAATVGQSVFAVGNAGGVGGTPAWASGSVTDTDRSVVATNEHSKSTESLTGMLQTTAPIVPGYSGGALVNTAGEVVGVNTCGSFPTVGKPATASYAIPIAKAMRIANAIVTG